MKARVVTVVLFGLILALIPAMLTHAQAQQARKTYRIGWVSPGFALTPPGPVTLAFNGRLRDNGLIEGENVVVDRHFMGGREDQYATVLTELERRVDVIVVSGPPAALAAKQVVTKVPVIFAAVGDPVGIGLVQSLSKPGGNFTGVAFDVSPEIAVKRVVLLKEVFPQLVRVAALWSSADPVGIRMWHTCKIRPRPFRCPSGRSTSERLRTSMGFSGTSLRND